MSDKNLPDSSNEKPIEEMTAAELVEYLYRPGSALNKVMKKGQVDRLLFAGTDYEQAIANQPIGDISVVDLGAGEPGLTAPYDENLTKKGYHISILGIDLIEPDYVPEGHTFKKGNLIDGPEALGVEEANILLLTFALRYITKESLDEAGFNQEVYAYCYEHLMQIVDSNQRLVDEITKYGALTFGKGEQSSEDHYVLGLENTAAKIYFLAMWASNLKPGGEFIITASTQPKPQNARENLFVPLTNMAKGAIEMYRAGQASIGDLLNGRDSAPAKNFAAALGQDKATLEAHHKGNFFNPDNNLISSVLLPALAQVLGERFDVRLIRHFYHVNFVQFKIERSPNQPVDAES